MERIRLSELVEAAVDMQVTLVLPPCQSKTRDFQVQQRLAEIELAELEEA